MGPHPNQIVEEMKQEERAKAEACLHILRERGGDDYSLMFRLLKESVDTAGIALEDLGTDQAELEELKRFYNLRDAGQKLEELRVWQWTGPSIEWMRHNQLAASIREHVANAGGTLPHPQVDITDEALSELVRSNHRRDAEALLPHMREAKGAEGAVMTWLLVEFQEHLRRAGGLAPEDVGCSPEEFSSFQ